MDTSPIWKRTVGTGWHGVSPGDGGTLAIYPGRIVLTMKPLSRRFTGIAELVHTDRNVRLVHAVLFFPWSNVGLVLTQGEITVAAIIPVIRKRQLERALMEAGFPVHEEKTLFDIGFRRTR